MEKKGPKKKFSLMTDEEVIAYCQERYNEYGIEAISAPALEKVGVYHNLYRRGITQKKLLKLLNLEEEFCAWKKLKDGLGGRCLLRSGLL